MSLSLPAKVDDEDSMSMFRYLADEAAPRRQEIKSGPPHASAGEEGVQELRVVDGCVRMYVRHKGKWHYLDLNGA